MCGIAGIKKQATSLEEVHQMTTTLTHRGPDYGNSYISKSGSVGLGHRRLSILDLSDTANQPFYSHCGRYVMVYNGEVYNFKEIKAQLVGKDWKTDGDTEVILEAFVEWGADFVKKLNGMFAFSIYDIEEDSLYLFRDRLGIKPLYYYWDHSIFAFASELKAIKSLALPLQLNRAAISQFLYLGYAPNEETFFQNTYKLPAGHIGELKNNNWKLRPYWQIEDKFDTQTLKNEVTAKKKLKELLFSSIDYRMISDVPLGTFLSGGIDSSTVTAIAQQLSSKPVKTFSIGFKENKFNESEHAAQVAKYLGTDHHEFIVSEKDALELFDGLLDMHDQPFADSSAIPTFLVSKMARKEVTVALSGDGGDELFMGYGMYNWAQRLDNPLLKIGRKPISWLLNSTGKSRLSRAAKVFEYPDAQRKKSHIFSQEQYLFSAKELKGLLLPAFQTSLELDESLAINSRKLSAREQQALFDVKNYLKDDLLVKVDIASMQNSLEVRVPLLDHRVVEFAMNVNEKLKYKGANQKYLLKQVLYDFVPPEYFDRPKWGFSIPLINWLQKELKYLVDEFLSESCVKEVGVVNYAYVSELKKRFFNGQSFLYNRVWVLILLHKWLKN